MALTISQLGEEISTEKLVIRALTDAPSGQVIAVVMEVFINDVTLLHTLEHQPILGTNNTFDFEINSIVKDYFASQFLPLTGVNQTAIENAIVSLRFYEVTVNGILSTAYPYSVIVKNMTQDTFEIEDFNLADYDCGDAGSATSKLLTTSPLNLPVGDKTSIHVSCLTTSYTGTTPKQEWVLQTLLNGVLVTQFTDPVDVPTRGIIGHVAGGKYDISTYRIDWFGSVFDEARIFIRDIASPFTVRSETKVYKLNDSCERDITLSWLNEFGAQDTFTFLGNITRTGKYTDSTFKRTRPVEPLSTDVGDLVYKSNYNYQYQIFSDRMPENSVQWLSKILINKRAAIQSKAIKQTVSQAKSLGLLYNWYVVDQGNGGNGTATGGIVNQSQTGWRVPSFGSGTGDYNILKLFLTSNAGSLKQVGLDNWNAPNTGATNITGFSAVGSGLRGSTFGLFGELKQSNYLMTYEDLGAQFAYYKISYNTTTFLASTTSFDIGVSIRLVRDAVGGENDGDFITGAYTGNNGEVYDGVVIGTQVWINRNLYETKLNDGSNITNVTDGATWAALTTGAYCVYNNDALLPTVIPVPSKYFPIVIETDETVLDDKFTPETIFKLKFRLANRRKGLK